MVKPRLRQLDRFADAISRALRRGGSVLIPAFAVDRTEVVLLALRELVAAGQVPAVPVYVDSPMALAALDVYRNALRARSPEVRALPAGTGGDPFDPGTLRVARSVPESTALNHPDQPCIIISAAGMATGGRVVLMEFGDPTPAPSARPSRRRASPDGHG